MGRIDIFIGDNHTTRVGKHSRDARAGLTQQVIANNYVVGALSEIDTNCFHL